MKNCTKILKTHRNINSSKIDRKLPILRSEITEALRLLKNKKAPRSNQITTEILKALGTMKIDELHTICNYIWQHENGQDGQEIGQNRSFYRCTKKDRPRDMITTASYP